MQPEEETKNKNQSSKRTMYRVKSRSKKNRVREIKQVEGTVTPQEHDHGLHG
jgi:hypothetical protein